MWYNMPIMPTIKKNAAPLHMRFHRNFYLLRNRVMANKNITNSSAFNNEILTFVEKELAPLLSEIVSNEDLKPLTDDIAVRCLLTNEQRKAIDFICDTLKITDKNIYVIGLMVTLFKKN